MDVDTYLAPFPDELKRLKRWVCWAGEERQYKGDTYGPKAPWHPNGFPASSAKPATWSTFEACVAAVSEKEFHGVGIMLGQLEDGRTLGGVDLDHVCSGATHPEALRILSALDSYTEVSPGGDGTHTLLWAAVPSIKVPNWPDVGMGVEIYTSGRYFTATGIPVGARGAVEPRQEQLAKLRAEMESVLRHGAARTPSAPHAFTGETTPYGMRALEAETAEVAATPFPGRNTRLNDAAFSIGQLVAGGEIDPSDARPALIAAALAAGLGESESVKTIQSGLSGGGKAPRSAPPRNDRAPVERGSHPPPHDDAERMMSEPRAEVETPAVAPGAGAIRDLLYPFATVTLDGKPPAPTAWIVEGVLAEEACLLLAAAQKTGKTWWTFMLAICCVTGLPFFGCTMRRRGEALLYTPESGVEAKRRRLWGLCWGLGLDPLEVLPHIHLVAERITLTKEEHAGKLADTVERINPVVTVADPFVSLAAGSDENAAESVQLLLDRLRDSCSGPGRGMVLAHHHNKGDGTNLANSVRGSSAFGGWWDSLVTLRREESNDAACERRVDVEHRDEAPPASWGFQIQAVAHPEASKCGVVAFRLEKVEPPEVTMGRGKPQSAASKHRTDEISRRVSGNPGITKGELASQMAVAARTIGRHIKNLEASGLVRVDGNHVFPTCNRTDEAHEDKRQAHDVCHVTGQTTTP